MEGNVANYVETEQLVEVDGGLWASSVVQVRGSIPLVWHQQDPAASLNPKPEIVLLYNDPLYEQTRRHFRELVLRFGRPALVLDLIKQGDRRESVLGREYRQAVEFANRQGSDSVL